jgi:hypothetical protein
MACSPGEPGAQLAVVFAFTLQVGFDLVEPSGDGENAEKQADGAAEQAGACGDGQGNHCWTSMP